MPRLIISLLLAVFFAYSCTEKSEFNVGFVATLSNKKSEVGIAARDGIMMKIQEINNKGGVDGRKINLVIRDLKGEKDLLSTYINEFERNGIKFVIGPMLSRMAETLERSVRNKDILVISPTMATDYLSGKDDNILRLAYSAKQQGKLIAKEALNDGVKKVAVVFDLANRSYSESIYLAFRSVVEKKNINIEPVLSLGNYINKGMNGFSEIISKSGADGLFLIVSPVDGAFLAQRVKKLNKNIKIYGVTWTKTDEFIRYGGVSVEGAKLTSVISKGAKNEKFKDFKDLYNMKYGKEIHYAAIRAYDAMSLLGYGLDKSLSGSPESVKKEILNKKNFEGVESPIVVNKFGDSIGNYGIVIVRNGRYELSGKLDF